MNKYVLQYTDMGDTCDGLARVEGKYKTLEEAQEAMQKDVAYYMNANGYNGKMLTECDGNHTLVGDEEQGCLWQILEI
jgi:hypothetical protein